MGFDGEFEYDESEPNYGNYILVEGNLKRFNPNIDTNHHTKNTVIYSFETTDNHQVSNIIIENGLIKSFEHNNTVINITHKRSLFNNFISSNGEEYLELNKNVLDSIINLKLNGCA